MKPENRYKRDFEWWYKNAMNEAIDSHTDYYRALTSRNHALDRVSIACNPLNRIMKLYLEAQKNKLRGWA